MKKRPAEPRLPYQRVPNVAAARALPKRFYSAVTVEPVPPPTAAEGTHWHVLLDGRPLRTPAKKSIHLPTRALAEAIAGEWSAQDTRLNPATMPLTKLANSAVDGVCWQEHPVRADIVKYAGSDLLCYRADRPRELIKRQALAWDPILAWTHATLGVQFAVSTGVMPGRQAQATTATMALTLEHYDGFSLAALHVLTTLTGSALLALALARGRLSAETAWAAAHVDEDWQISQWGEDAEATARRARRWTEMYAASRMLTLVAREVVSPPLP